MVGIAWALQVDISWLPEELCGSKVKCFKLSVWAELCSCLDKSWLGIPAAVIKLIWKQAYLLYQLKKKKMVLHNETLEHH